MSQVENFRLDFATVTFVVRVEILLDIPCHFSYIAGNSVDIATNRLRTTDVPSSQKFSQKLKSTAAIFQRKTVIPSDFSKKAVIFFKSVENKSVPLVRLQCSSPMVITLPGGQQWPW